MANTTHITLPPYFTQDNIDQLAKLVPVHIDRVLLFYSYLMYRNFSEADKNELNFKQSRVSYFHKIHSDILKVIFGRAKYRIVLQILSAHNLLEVNESYWTGVQTESSKYAGYPKAYKIPFELVSPKYENCRLKSNLQDVRTINAKQNLISAIRLGKHNTVRLDEGVKRVLLNSIDNIEANTLPQNKQFELATGPSMCRFGNRLHSCITNLNKKYRTDIRFKGSDEPLTEIDITSSQMYFFVNLRTDLVSEVLPPTDAKLVNQKINSLLKCPGYIKFRYQVLYGDKDIYQEFADEFKIERDEAKELMFTIFFGSKYIKKQDQLAYFENRFPGLLYQLNELKSFKLTDSPSRKTHSNLTLILQRIESKMVLENSIIAAADQGITDILTIHDSWLVKESQAEEFESILTSIFFKRFLAAPEFRIKPYGIIAQNKKRAPSC